MREKALVGLEQSVLLREDALSREQQVLTVREQALFLREQSLSRELAAKDSFLQERDNVFASSTVAYTISSVSEPVPEPVGLVLESTKDSSSSSLPPSAMPLSMPLPIPPRPLQSVLNLQRWVTQSDGHILTNMHGAAKISRESQDIDISSR